MASIRLFDWEVRQLGKSLKQEWEDALGKLRTANVGKDEYDNLYRRIQLSVDNLRDAKHPGLQDCFIYFAAFPEDYEVDMELLVSIWIAEGIVQIGQDNLVSARDEGRALVGLLVSKSMIELISEGDYNVCKIHDVMRDLAHRNLKWMINQKHNLVEIVPSERTCLYVPKEWIPSGIRCSVKRMSLHSNNLEQLPDQFNAPSLRVLILTANSHLRALTPGFFKSLARLTVLDLSETGVEEISDIILSSLKALVFLNLKGCRFLRKISDRIGDLQNLQSVILDKCTSLQKLPHMTGLTKLHTLSLPRTVYTRTSVLLQHPRKDIRQLLQLCSVKRLHIYLRTSIPIPDISTLVALEELKMEDVVSFPPGMSQLLNLKTLHVVIKYAKHPFAMPELETLPLLEDLEITAWLKNAYDENLALPESFGRNGAFPSLKRMSILGQNVVAKKPNSPIFTFHQGAMPKIQRLKMSLLFMGHVPTSVTVLGSSLNFLQIVGRPCQVENLELVLSDQSKFPNLEFLELYLELQDKDRLSSTIAALPRLRWLQWNIGRKDWPENLSQLEDQGKLMIDTEKIAHAYAT